MLIRPVKEYSLGMKQRLGIAMALIHKPKLLILDEPTNGLDPAGIQEIRNLIKELPTLYDSTVLISSHLLSEVEQIATHVGIIHHGQLIFQDQMDILQQHRSPVTYVELEHPEEAYQTLLGKGWRVDIETEAYPFPLQIPKIEPGCFRIYNPTLFSMCKKRKNHWKRSSSNGQGRGELMNLRLLIAEGRKLKVIAFSCR